jgi:hypothetical protein
MSNFLCLNETGGDGLGIKGQPDAGVAQSCHALMVVRPDHHQRGYGSRPNHGGIRRGESGKNLLRTPPGWKQNGHDFGAGADVEGESGNRDYARKQQAGV